jgi:serine-type D-Ala-D-Ala carboxypeptidase/endopeptidase
VLGPGTFGAMGGLLTSANDYARYIAWELAAWPSRDGPEDGILARASVREIQRPMTYAVALPSAEAGGCARSISYGLGMNSGHDCVLGFQFGHSGGLPGYGSNVLFLRDRGIGIFVFANRTYAGASVPVRAAATLLVKSGAFPPVQASANPELQSVAAAVAEIYATGDVLTARQLLAENILLDQSAEQRNSQIRGLKAVLGACKPANPIAPGSRTAATITYSCEHGTLRVRVLLAPTSAVAVQRLEFLP